MDKQVRDAIHPLLHDIANSEHRHRHPAAFDALCKECGMDVAYSPSVTRVRTPDQVKADDEKAAQDAADAAAAAKAATAEGATGRKTEPNAAARKEDRKG